MYVRRYYHGFILYFRWRMPFIYFIVLKTDRIHVKTNQNGFDNKTVCASVQTNQKNQFKNVELNSYTDFVRANILNTMFAFPNVLFLRFVHLKWKNNWKQFELKIRGRKKNVWKEV